METQTTPPLSHPQLPQSSPSPSNHKLLKVFLLFIGFIQIAVICASVYFSYQANQQVVDVPIVQPLFESTTQETIDDWKIYKNEEYGFKLQYPS
ncbi:hypothetical protein HY468_02270, partial [Candidatus Roizmanbacteria bacterium]|nr:hypothetical protein [Candidatus Roizmanbacteria bacterium]